MKDELMHLLDEHHKAKTRLAFINERRSFAEKEAMRYRSEAADLERRVNGLTEEIESLMK